ncbi:MAG: nucleotidyltransferase domain-containing protein [Pseudomonadota bacterium]
MAILRFLYRNRPNRFSQKQISDSVGIHPSTISRACNSLEQLKLIDRFNAGKTILYKLDEESYITRKIIIPLFAKERNFFKDFIKDILQSLDQNLKALIKEIFLFGSIVKGDDTPSSDIDIAIVIRSNAEIEKVKEHFLNEAVKLKLNLDIHIFIEGEENKEKGLSLDDVYKQGELIWVNNGEELSKE